MIQVDEIKLKYKISAFTPNLKRVGRSFFAGPCPMCGGDDRFVVKETDLGEVWLCRHCGDGKYRDVIDLVAQLNRCDFILAVQILTGGDFVEVEGVPAAPQVRKVAEVPEADWQSKAHEIWLASHTRLLERIDVGESDTCLTWLMSRGITPKEIKAFGLGYHLGGNGLAKGIVIPAFYEGNIQYLKVRKKGKKKPNIAGDIVTYDKYRQLAGGKSNSLFNADGTQRKNVRKIVVVEGEFDAMLLSRFVDERTAVVTMGTAKQVPEFSEWGHLFSMADLWIYQDDDKAGNASVEKWLKAYPYARRLTSLGAGMDVTDYWKSGGDLKGWLKKNFILL